MEKPTCIDCGKELRKIKAACPSCKDGDRCFKCWTAHLDAKVCAYGRAKVISVPLGCK